MTRILAALAFAFALVGSYSPARADRPVVKDLVVVKAGRLFDGTGDSVRPDRVIVIEGDRIKEVGPVDRVAIPEGAKVIDLSGVTVLPGLIDCHTHLGSRGDRFDEIYRFRDTPE